MIIFFFFRAPLSKLYSILLHIWLSSSQMLLVVKIAEEKEE